MLLKALAVGMFGTNCYVVVSEKTREGMIIDPGADTKGIIKTASDLNSTIGLIAVTHGHMDHVGALKNIRQHTKAPFAMHAEDVPLLGYGSSFMAGAAERSPGAPDRLLDDGDVVSIGELRFTVLHTPGHSPGGICLAGNGVVFSGDTLFNYGIGRTDFPGCSYDQLMESIVTRLLPLPDETTVYPGHGPPTTIGEERKRNPFIAEYLHTRGR